MRSESTPAMDELGEAGIPFVVVRTERAASVEESAALQGIDVAHLIKSLIVRLGDDYIFVLMPGPRQMSWPKLRQALGVSRVTMPSPEEARAATGYERGAITPLGARGRFSILADTSIPEGTVAIGGGAHGVNIHIESSDLLSHLGADSVELSEP